MTILRLCAFLAMFLFSARTAPQEPPAVPAQDDPAQDAAAPAEDDPPASTPDLNGFGTFIDSTLGDMMASPEAFATPLLHPEFEPLPPPARNPFLLLEEQAENRPFTEIATEREAVRTAEAAASAATAAAPDDAALRRAVSLLRLSAVLVAPDGGTALIDGRLVRLGDQLLDGRVTVTAVSRQGVVLATPAAEYVVPLPPPNAAPRPDASAEPIEEEP
ncbi:MAG: hypothetical protein HY812_22460 [Planctomycetes bacterium]|nr:hypothetical protein [Planctomycetota bacterium]